MLLLPDGRLLSRHWRPVVWLTVASAVTALVGFFTYVAPIEDLDPSVHLMNPFGLEALGELPLQVALTAAAVLGLILAAGGVGALLRFRRSRGVERQQLRWVAFAGLITALSLQSLGFLPGVIQTVIQVGLFAIPVCVGVAILRYHLCDLGRIVSRTVSYAIVIAVLLGIYVAGVTSSARLAPGSSSLAVAASTLAIAALFQPLRRRVQSAVDHRFNRARYDADRTVEAFTRRLREEVDLDAVRADVGPGTLTGLGALIDTYGWVVSALLGACLPLLLLPDGRLPSPAWRPVPWALLAGCLVGLARQAAVPGALSTGAFPDVVNPFGFPQLGPLPALLANLAGLTVLLGTCAGAASVVARYRRSSGVHRQQLRWVATGGCCALFGVAISLPAPQHPVGLVAGVIAANAIPVSIGVAVLRYRLYDLGRLVSRAVSYALLTALLASSYVLLVGASARLLPVGSSLGVAAATLGAAALFQPLRRRVQSAVDTRFNRARYDADQTLEVFTRTLRDEVDLEAVRSGLLRAVQDTVQPQAVGLWLRDADRRRPEGTGGGAQPRTAPSAMKPVMSTSRIPSSGAMKRR